MIVTVNTILVSISDKLGVSAFLSALQKAKRNDSLKIFATDGTYQALQRENKELPLEQLSQHISHPVHTNGLIKTLDFFLYAAILLPRKQVPAHPLPPIDLIVCNLYPFSDNYRKKAPLEQAKDLIDIGGVSLLRAGAKNFTRVSVLYNINDFPTILKEIQQQGGVTLATRAYLATKTFSYIAQYDQSIASYFQEYADEL